jgi:hypothetical protein
MRSAAGRSSRATRRAARAARASAHCASTQASYPRTARGLSDATTDEAQVAQWWTRWPDANVAIHLAKSELAAIDCDPRHGGDATNEELIAEHGDWPDTPTQLSGGGGWHRIYAYSADTRLPGTLGGGIDVKHNGYIVMAPSLHESGQRYVWEASAHPDDIAVARLPKWVAALTRAYGTSEGWRFADGEAVAEGRRNQVLYRHASAMRRNGLERPEIEAALLAINEHRCRPPLPESEVRGIAESASHYQSNAAPERNATGIVPIDWRQFWTETSVDDAEWIIEPLVPSRRQVAMFSAAKLGKSVLALDTTAARASGRTCLGRPAEEPIDIVYIDQEMTRDDLHERLVDLGYGPETDLSRFHYYQLTNLPPLDSEEGGNALIHIVRDHSAVLVVLDTMSRVVEGKEDDSDTYRAFYRYTGMALKAEKVALWRLDHSGYDRSHMRGSSSKNDDPDVVWRLELTKGGEIALKRTHSRIPWVPERVVLQRQEDPTFRHIVAPIPYSGGTLDCVRELGELDVPLDATYATAQAALRKSGHGRRRTVVLDALRYRRHVT